MYTQHIIVVHCLFSQDLIADVQDVEEFLMKELPSENIIFSKRIESYAHLDFTWAANAKEMVYDDLMKLLQEYNPLLASVSTLEFTE